jgi:tRNA threonylcarbamoyladenosine biosynthesis protein TsaE
MTSFDSQDLPSIESLEAFAKRFVQSWSNGAKVALHGELGAGKTAFVKACIGALSESSGVKIPRVVSPTYVLHQSYPELVRTVEHFDFYRMDAVAHDDLIEIGFWDAVDRASATRGFVFVEWALRLDGPIVDFDTALSFTVDASGHHRVQGPWLKK